SFFLSIGSTLCISLLITVIVEIVLALLGINLGIISYIVVLIFCGYIGYDWAKANAVPKTIDNAIDSAAELYVDIIALFMRVLSILARAND
ncbi:MAG: US12 family protein, partial [Lachnospiraceae bacterium]|nr:US12 family protein [Lachnospiraceae bacterium]